MDRAVTYLVKFCGGSVVLAREINMTAGIAID